MAKRVFWSAFALLRPSTLTASMQLLQKYTEDSDGSVPVGCEWQHRLVFQAGKVSDNALGGRGGNETAGHPHSLRYGDVLAFGKKIDMIVTASSLYFGNEASNRAIGDFATLDLHSGGYVTLEVRFEDRMTRVPVAMDAFHFTVSNLGRFDDEEGGSKGFSMAGEVSYTLSADTYIEVEEEKDTEGNVVSQHFRSSYVGKRGEHVPSTTVADMSEEDLANSVSMLFPKGTKGFQMTLFASPGKGNRDFYFGGASNAVCERVASCTHFECTGFYKPKGHLNTHYCAESECVEEVDLANCCEPWTPATCLPGYKVTLSANTLMYDNLGGVFNESEPKGIRFHNVFLDDEQPIDLLIQNTTEYTPSPGETSSLMLQDDASKDSYLSIGIMHDTAVALSFQFLDQHGAPAELPSAYSFALLDIDMGEHMNGVEEVAVTGHKNFTLSSNSSIHVFEEGSSCGVTATFMAMVPGNSSNNPSDPWNQTQEELSKSVTLDFGKSTNTFAMNVRVIGGSAGRKLEISGWSAIECPEFGSYCATMQCPAGYFQPDGKARCAGPTCGPSDFNTCCTPEPFSGCSVMDRIQFTTDSLAENNLGGIDANASVTTPPIMRVVDILPQGDVVAEMKISVSGQYDVIDPLPENGLTGGFIKIDVLPGKTVHLNLEIFDMHTTLLLPSTFHLTVASLPVGQSVTAMASDYFNMSESSSLSVEPHGNQVTTFAGTVPNAILSKHAPSLLFNKHDLASSVAFHYTNKSSVQLELSVAGDGETNTDYRSFFISGSSPLCCPAKVALCSSMVCPDTHRLKASAAILSCKGSECLVPDDLDTCCDKVDFITCDPSTNLVLTSENLMLSNLGGTGPGTGKKALIFTDVFPSSGQFIDLEITNMTPYVPYHTANNGVTNGFGAISLRPKSSTRFKFRFVDHAERKPIELPGAAFPLSFVNMLGSVNSITGVLEGQLSLELPEAQHHVLSDRSFVRQVGHKFTAFAHGGRSSPRHPMELSVDQMHKALSVSMEVPEFTVTVDVGDSHDRERMLMFSGATNLVCPYRAFCNTHKCPSDMVLIGTANTTACQGGICTTLDTPTCCRFAACDDKNAMSILRVKYSNLGGKGPDTPTEGQKFPTSLIFEDVFPASGSTLHLAVTVIPGTEYYPHEPSRNGMPPTREHYGLVNLETGSEADLEFQIIDDNYDPVPPRKFLLTFSGIDEQADEMGRETATIWGSLWYKVSKDTALFHMTNETDGSVTFKSTERGGVEGSYTNPHDLSGAMQQHSVTFMMNTDRWHGRFSTTQGWAGRNFLFAGPSSLVCGRRASCTTMVCDEGYGTRCDADLLYCKGSVCYKDRDHDTCCKVVGDIAEGASFGDSASSQDTIVESADVTAQAIPPP